MSVIKNSTYHELVCLRFEWLIKKLQQIGTVLKLCKAPQPLLISNVLEKEIQDDSERWGGGGGVTANLKNPFTFNIPYFLIPVIRTA